MPDRRSLTPGSVARGVATVLAAAVAGLFLAPALLGGHDRTMQLGHALDARAPDRFRPAAARVRTVTRYTTLIATARHGTLRVYRTRGTRRHAARFGGLLRRRTLNTHPLPLVLTVTDHSHPGWLRVRLPIRPNGALAWIKRGDVRISATNFRVSVELKRHRIVVHRGRALILDQPIGVGRALSPTPRGTYFLADLVKSTDPFYGPYAFGLSAFSTVYTTFEGGNGQVGIHGTDAPAAIGTDVSHGCIRVRNAIIRKLAKLLPLGTPVQITN